MALPISHPLQEMVLDGTVASAANAVLTLRAPFKGRILEVGTMIGSATVSNDATVTTTIAGTAVTGGSFVITQSGSAAGDLDAASVSGVVANGVTANSTITGANTFNEGDSIRLAITGSGATGGGILYYYAVVARG
jgi:hypothetical protein